MSHNSKTRKARGVTKGRLIATGFLLAFATSVGTVIYTGLNVEGNRAEFDAETRLLTLHVGESHVIALQFESERAASAATLEVNLPAGVDFEDRAAWRDRTTRVDLVPGKNTIPLSIVARDVGSGYLVARVAGDAPIGLYRIFLTVVDE